MCSLYRNEYRYFKLARATMRSGVGRSEEAWKRQINWHCNTYMHRNSTRKLPCSYLYLKLAKGHVSCFIFYVCFFHKIGEQEGGTGSAGQCRGSGGSTTGRGKVAGKEVGG
jgi:hypothetical protein